VSNPTRVLHNLRVANNELISSLDSQSQSKPTISSVIPFPPLTVMSDHAKRTRSQLVLPEEFGEVLLGISPLRAARLERKRNIQTDPPAGPSDATPPSVEAGGDEGDDELLLSPHKTRPPKRQPLSQQPESPSRTDHEREYKRLKQDHSDGEYPA
jgi:hypothetical protein